MPPRPSRYDRQQDQQEATRNQQQATRDSQQDQQIQNLQNRLTGVETDVVQQGAQANTLQRLRINIPNPSTHFLLGQRVTADPAFGYTGASLQAADNLFIDIAKNTVIQTQGFTTLQSNTLWQQYSGSLMELSSPTAVKVVGGQVFLGATDTVEGPAAKPNNGENLTVNTGNDLHPAIDHLKAVGSGWDIGLSVLSLVATGVFFSPLDPTDANSWIKTAETAWSTLKKGYDLWNKVDSLVSPSHTPKKDVSIFGKDGVTIMSPEKISLSTQSSMKLFAQGGVSLTSGQSSSIMAVQGVKCFGALKASLEGGTYADVKAGVELGVACYRGKLKLKGKKIDIGTDKPKWTQLPTNTITLKALEDITFNSKKTLKIVTGTTTDIQAKENFQVKADKAVQIYVGSYAIEIKPDGIKIGKGSNGTPSDPIITIDGETISLGSSGMGTKITKSRVFIGKQGTNMTVADSGTVFVKGNVIKLG